LPVRDGENVVVWAGRFDDASGYDAHVAALGSSPRWRESVRCLDDRLTGPPQTLLLAPAARSQLA
jgi:hypothetical protein